MAVSGSAQLGKKTKDLVRRLRPGDIAIIDHEDIDRVSAESLVSCSVKAVINAARSISGRYPNVGPGIIVDAGIALLDEAGQAIFEKLRDNDHITIEGDTVYLDSVPIASGTILDGELVHSRMAAAEDSLDAQMEQFVTNTVRYIEMQKGELIFDPWVPEVATQFRGRHALVVVRGYDYREDLRMLKPYIHEVKPILIGVDGGADALLEAGFKPHIIIGDMDSVSDKALLSGAEIIAHAFEDGLVTASGHLDELGLTYTRWPLSATSEDLALLLAWEKKADLIVALGTHSNLVEYLDKGRSGMASSFLVRLKVGSKLLDAKGVNQLYRSSVSAIQVFPLLLAAIGVIAVLVYISPAAHALFELLLLRIRFTFGF